MRFDPPLVCGRFIRRYKRFFAEISLPDGERVIAHCTNTGALRGCLIPGAPALIEPAANPRRKLAWTWVAIEVDGCWVGVDTGKAEALVAEAIDAGMIPQLAGFTRRWRQVPYGAAGRSRVDLLLSRGGRAIAGAGRVDRQGDARVYVEVKNTTLVYQTGEDPRAAGRRLAAFPDAVTERGRKHLHELQHVVTQEGQRAALVLCVQRSDCDAFAPADAIDPAWGSAARAAVAAGVEVYALCGAFAPAGITLDRRLPIEL